MSKFTRGEVGVKTVFPLIIGAILLVVGWLCFDNLVETVDKGTYHIKQAAVVGTLSAKMKPGMYAQMFGDITVWPVAETFFFTADSDEGARHVTTNQSQFVSMMVQRHVSVVLAV
jgi:hypothetical protein